MALPAPGGDAEDEVVPVAAGTGMMQGMTEFPRTVITRDLNAELCSYVLTEITTLTGGKVREGHQ